MRGAMVKNPYVGSASAAIDYLQLRNTLLMVREHSGNYHAFIRFCIALWHLASGAVVPARRGPYWDVEGSRARARRLPARPLRSSAAAPTPQALTSPSFRRPDSRADGAEVPRRDDQAADHGEHPEHDRRHPHHAALAGERPRPFRTMGGVEQGPHRDAERDAGKRCRREGHRPIARPNPSEHNRRVVAPRHPTGSPVLASPNHSYGGQTAQERRSVPIPRALVRQYRACAPHTNVRLPKSSNGCGDCGGSFRRSSLRIASSWSRSSRRQSEADSRRTRTGRSGSSYVAHPSDN